MKVRTKTLLSLACAAAFACSAQAGVLVYDGAYGDGWSAQQWDMTTNADLYHGDSGPSLATLSTGGGITSVGIQHAGLMVSPEDAVLSFWVNTSDGAESGDLMVAIRWIGATDDHNFDQRNIPAVYNVDGTDFDYPVRTDADSSTWQKITVDLTQTRYPGWPYVPTTWDPETMPLTRIVIKGNSSNLIVDDITLGDVAIPEPTMLGVLGFAGLALARRRSA